MHILHGKKIEQPIEKLSEIFLDLSLNWAAVGELNKRWFKAVCSIEQWTGKTFAQFIGFLFKNF